MRDGTTMQKGVRPAMTMKCITVYTKSYETFSDIYEQVAALNLAENEETEVEGITVSEAGEVDQEYIQSMKIKPEVAVLKVKDSKIMILQHGDVFEILIPSPEEVGQH